jgi:3-hydroxyisobutyrate dehydrogenase
MNQASEKPALKVGFVGVGRMGSAMLQCVLNAGYHVTLYDPAVQATAPFAAAHPDRVRVAASPKEAAQNADVTDVVVNTNEQLLEACLGPNGVLAGAREGSVVLVHSTITRDTLQRVARAASEREVHLLDAMVSGARGHLSVGNLAVMVGGDAQAFARARPVMETYGGLVLHLGPAGAGLDAKLAINLVRYLCRLASQEASLLAERAGIAAAMDQLVAHTESNRYVGNLSRLQEIPLQQRRKDAETAQKDLRAAVARGAELGLHLSSAEHAIALMHRLWAAEE